MVDVSCMQFMQGIHLSHGVWVVSSLYYLILSNAYQRLRLFSMFLVHFLDQKCHASRHIFLLSLFNPILSDPVESTDDRFVIARFNEYLRISYH